MTATCPRCGSVDLQSSRSKGPLDAIARVLGLPPRRCTACGWRGIRPRLLAPARHGSSPSLPIATEQPKPDPAPVQEHHRRRKHHHKHHVRTSKGPNLMVVLAAVMIGVATGLVVYAFLG